MRLLAGLICAAGLAAAIYNPVTGWVEAPGGSYPTPTSEYLYDEGSGATLGDSIALNDCSTGDPSPVWETYGFYTEFNAVSCGVTAHQVDLSTEEFSFCFLGRVDTGIAGTFFTRTEGAGDFSAVRVELSATGVLKFTGRGSGNYTLTADAAVDEDQWHLYCVATAAAPSASNTKLYIDGVSVAATSAGTYAGDSTIAGQDLTLPSARVDAIRSAVWTTQLSDAQVAAYCTAAAATAAARGETYSCS